MDPEDPFAGMDPETIRRGSMRTLRAMFPELFASEPDEEQDPEPEGESEEHPTHAAGYEESDPHADEDAIEHKAGSMDG